MSNQTTDTLEEPTKQWVPLENNPQVLNHLAHTLGLSPAYSFHDVYSLDDPSLLNHIPRPALALILVAPAAVYHAYRATEPSPSPKASESTTGTSETAEEGTTGIVWFKQTIGNACGTIATIHALVNASPPSPPQQQPFILPSTPLASLLHSIKTMTPPSPTALASLLSTSPALEAAHAAAAALGDTTAPPADELASELHFICFVKDKRGWLWEVEGNWDAGPLERGVLGEEEDVLSARAVGMGVGRYFGVAERLRAEGKEGGLDGFSVTVLAGSGMS